MSEKENKGTVQSVERAIQILRLFEEHEKLGITEISRKLGLHKSTAYGLVHTLAVNGFIAQNEETGRYMLGTELLRISSRVQSGLRDIGAPHVKQMMEFTGETANLVVRDGAFVVYIDKQEGTHSMRICTSIGQKLPMYCTAVGKAILANLPWSEAEALIDSASFQPYTENTVKTKRELISQLDQVKKNGYALDDEELEYGLVCVGVPIFGRNKIPVGALSVSGPKQRMSTENITKIYPEILKHAREISQRIF